MSTNLNPETVARQPISTPTAAPEIHEAMQTLRAADFRLEAEYFAFDWEARLELAEELRGTLNDLDERQADVLARVAEDLDDECEDFSQWETRSEAAARVRTVIRSIEKKEVTANA